MPGKIKVKILAGRNLPVMDRSSDTTDAYVEIKFGNTTYKTDVCRKSLNPQWNSEWYRFEVDDSELQDEPLQIKLMDHDTYSANDAIGKVYVNLNPLLLPGVPPPVKNIWTLEATLNSSGGSQKGSVMTGWVPVFDTMHGIRGEVNIIVKVELFLDFNKFRQSSCGVQFFYSPNVPIGYHAQVIHGFVEELIVTDDPEYKWIDKIRTPRASNESRQTLFFKLSGEVQRKIGLKALDLGGNAVIGYLQNFDLEGESGIVARGIGTAVTLVKKHDIPNTLPEDTVEELATFGSKSKKHADNPDFDDNSPFLSYSPNLTPNISPTNLTYMSQKFPNYGRTTPKHSQSLIKVIDYRNQSNLARPFSPSSYNCNSRKILDSSLSLSEDVIDESSVRNLLALEDLRGEPGRNRFSRSLKNLKYLQQNVLSKRVTQLRSKMSESFDEESDGDSTYSSTWSIAGTDSTRSSALDLRKNGRTKSFSRSKSANDGMVALLIKSVHTGFPAPLDIVKEDRETPAPSPVKFLADGSDSTKLAVDSEKTEKESDNKDNGIFANSSNTEATGSNYNPVENIFNTLDNNFNPVDKYNSIDNQYGDFSIPMISSSETDTSSEEDEPSESSTNYNILDDTSSLNELVLPEMRKSRRTGNKLKSKEKSSLLELKITRSPVSRKDSFPTDGSTSTEPTSSDVDSDFFHDKLEKKTKNPEKKLTEIIMKETEEVENKEKDIEFEPEEIPFQKLEEDKDKEFPEIFEIVELVTDNKFETDKDKFEKEVKFETDVSKFKEHRVKFEIFEDLKFKDSLEEPLLLSAEIRNDDSNFEENPDNVHFSNLQIEETENQRKEMQAYNLSLSEDKIDESTPFIQPREFEESSHFYENDKNLESGLISDEDDNDVLSEPFFKDSRSTESIIAIQPEKVYEKIVESDVNLDYPEDNKSSFNDKKNIESNLINQKENDVFNEPFFRDDEKLDTTFCKDDKSKESNLIGQEENYKIFHESLVQDKENLKSDKFNSTFYQDDKNIESNLINQEKDYEVLKRTFQDKEKTENFGAFYDDKSKEKKVIEIFDEPFFKDDENSPLTVFRQEKINNSENNPQAQSFFVNNTIKSENSEKGDKDKVDKSENLLNFDDFQTNQNHPVSFSLDLENISNSKSDQQIPQLNSDFEKQKISTNDEKSLILLDDSNKFDNINIDKQNLNSFFSTELFLSHNKTDDLSKKDSDQELKSPSINQEIFDLSLDSANQNPIFNSPYPTFEISGKDFSNNIRSTKDNFLSEESKPENQLKAKRKSLIRQTSQYEEVLENLQLKTETKSHEGSETLSSNSSEEKLNTEKFFQREEKSPRRVERTDTVIYKGPLDEKGRPLTPKIEKRLSKESSANLSPIPIFVEHFSDKSHFLKVPIAHTLDVNVKSTYTKKETELAETMVHKAHQEEELKYAEILQHKFRRSCMLDLIKVIDTKMMNHTSHHSTHRKDSFRSAKKRRDKILKNLTPSPDSIQKVGIHKRRSKSKSPEICPFPSTSTLNSIHSSVHSHHHHHHHHSVKKHVSHNSSLDNTLKQFPDNVPNAVLMKDNLAKKIESSVNNEIHKAVVDKLAIEAQYREHSNINLELDNLNPDNCHSSVITPEIVESSLVKSSSICSLNKELELTKITNAAITDNLCVSYSPPPPRQQDENTTSPVHVNANSANFNNPATGKTTQITNSKNNSAVPLHRRSSDSDLSITPKGNSLASSEKSMGGYLKAPTAIRTMNQDASDMLEYPFLTMQQYPPGFVLHIGGLVSARSVKLLERISNLEEPESRDSWWTEIRMEVRSHARALACNVVIGYKEETSISDDVCVLNASGTAAVINLYNTGQDLDGTIFNRVQQGMAGSIDSDRDKPQQKVATKSDKNENEVTNQVLSGKIKKISESNDHEIPYSLPLSNCSLCHLPYNESSLPFRVNVSKCAVCRRAKVPDVLFTTIELPENVPVTGRGCFVQAIVCKCKKDLRGELNAKEISDCLPFLEYELHSLLLNKLKVKGMNSIFGLKVQVSVGEKLIIGMAIGTGVYLTSLPPPSMPQIASGNSWNNEEQLNEIQKNLVETVKKNREFYKLKNVDVDNGRSRSDTDESDDELPDMDLSLGTKDACILEVDDVEDMDRISLLMDDTPPDDFHVVNTQSVPGLEDLEIIRNLQMFTQVSRAKIPAGQFGSMPSKYFARLLQTVYFKLRRMIPCALCDMKFRVSLPEQDEIQLSVVGMALGLGEASKLSKLRRKLMPYSSSKDQLKKSDDGDMIFTLDEDVAETATTIDAPNSAILSQKSRARSPLRIKSHTTYKHKHVPLKERYGVDITPLSYLPGGRIERYLGNLNFFFIRESSSIRENGGISGFTHSFVNEVLAIVRAHVTTLGGNAMVAFFMTQCVLLHSPHKNHGQCLINVGGDVVSVSYFGDERQIGNTIC